MLKLILLLKEQWFNPFEVEGRYEVENFSKHWLEVYVFMRSVLYYLGEQNVDSLCNGQNYSRYNAYFVFTHVYELWASNEAFEFSQSFDLRGIDLFICHSFSPL